MVARASAHAIARWTSEEAVELVTCIRNVTGTGRGLDIGGVASYGKFSKCMFLRV